MTAARSTVWHTKPSSRWPSRNSKALRSKRASVSVTSRLAIVHRTGELGIGEVAVAVAAAAVHRSAAFDACEYAIDEVKRRAPIWKKERLRRTVPASGKSTPDSPREHRRTLQRGRRAQSALPRYGTRRAVPRGVSIVAGHGYSSSKHNFDFLCGFLASHGFGVYNFDFPGHKLGASGGALARSRRLHRCNVGSRTVCARAWR